MVAGQQFRPLVNWRKSSQNPLHAMPGLDQASHFLLFAGRLWLSCAAAGLLVGASTAVAMLYWVKFKPSAAERPHRWFLYPAAAGLATGVIVALAGVPPLSTFRLVWLLSAVIVAVFASLAAAAGVAYRASIREVSTGELERQRRRARRHSKGGFGSTLADFDRWLRHFFTPAHERDAKSDKKQEFRSAAGKLPTKRSEISQQRSKRNTPPNEEGNKVLQKPRRTFIERNPPANDDSAGGNRPAAISPLRPDS